MAAPLQCFLGTYEGELFGWTINPSASGAAADASHELTCAVKAHDASMRTSTSVRRGTSNMLLTSASDGSAKIYDLRASREVGTLLVEADAITVMRACGPDHVLTGHEGGFVRLWRTSDWSDVLTFRVHKKAAINDVAPHPTARVALSVGRDRSLRLIDLTKGKVVAVQDMGGREPREVRYSPDGSAFAVLFDSEVVVHDAATAEPRTRVSLPDAVVKFVSFAFVPLRGGGGGGSGGGDSCCLAIGCEGGALLLASPRDGAPLALHQTGHAGRVRCVAATAAAADALVFTLGADAVVHVWQAAALLAAATPAAPLQRLLAAKGFRGTCLTLVEAPAPSRPAPHGGAAAAGEAAVAGPASSGGGAAVPPGKKKVGGAQQRPSAAGSSDAAPAGGAAGGGAAAAAAAAGGGAAPKDAPPPHAASGAGGKRPEKRKRQVAFAPTE